MPHLLPGSVFDFQLSWMGPAGRLVWSLIFTTIGLLWVMLLMKYPAVKSPKIGLAIIVLGVGGGVTMVIIGKLLNEGSLPRETLIPNGFIVAWFAAITGLWTLMMSMNVKQLTLGFSRIQHVMGTIGLVVILYLLGGFVHAITLLCAWLIFAVVVASISLYIWSLPHRTRDATWAEAIAGALGVFVMMTLIYAVIPHEWITFATSYLNFTKDVKLSPGGEFVIQTWLNGDLWTSRTRVIPFEVNMVHIQDQATSILYVIVAVINVKLFAAWQKRNTPLPVKEETQESAPVKTSRFGRPLRVLRTQEA